MHSHPLHTPLDTRLTKHRDERSLSHYINYTASAQQRKCADILNDAFCPRKVSRNIESSQVEINSTAVLNTSSGMNERPTNIYNYGTVNIYQHPPPAAQTPHVHEGFDGTDLEDLLLT